MNINVESQSTALNKRKITLSTKTTRLIFIWGGLAPILLYFLVFSVFPIIAAIYISLYQWPLMGGERTFVNFDHYIQIIQDPRFWISMKNTTFFALAYVVLVIVLGLGMAVLINSLRPRLRLILRPIYFAPQVTSIVAVALMFAWLYQPRIGILNYLLQFLGLGPYLWLKSSSLVMPAIIATAVWRSVGYSMVIFTAGLLNIPSDLYDAAAVDGASAWRTFYHITLPMLQPTMMFMFVTATIGGFQVFVEPWLMTGGGPGTASRVMMLEIFEQGFRYFEMGEASALAVYLFIVIGVISYIQMRYLRESFEF